MNNDRPSCSPYHTGTRTLPWSSGDPARSLCELPLLTSTGGDRKKHDARADQYGSSELPTHGHVTSRKISQSHARHEAICMRFLEIEIENCPFRSRLYGPFRMGQEQHLPYCPSGLSRWWSFHVPFRGKKWREIPEVVRYKTSHNELRRTTGTRNAFLGDHNPDLTRMCVEPRITLLKTTVSRIN